MDFLRAVGLILLVGGTIVWWLTSRRLWRAVDTPTLATGHVTIGQIEVVGKAGVADGHPLVQSPLSAEPCVWFKAEVQQETGSGKNRSWKTRHTATSAPWITVDDGSGPVTIDLGGVTPSGTPSSIIAGNDLPTLLSATDLDFIAKGNAYLPDPTRVPQMSLVSRLVSEVVGNFEEGRPIAQLGGKWQVVEHRIELNSDLYVFGSTTYDDTAHAVRFAKSKSRPLFVYNGTQDRLVRNSRRLVLGAVAAVLIGAFTAGGAWWSLGEDPERRFNLGAAMFMLLPLVCFGLSVTIIRVRNRIAATATQIKSGQGLVDIALSKRANLIPNLVAVVQAAVGHSESVLERLTQLRTERVQGTEELAALTVLAERYPTLNTSPNFLQLQRSLSDVETDLAVANGFVVDAKAAHRTRIQSFPDSLVAKMFGLSGDEHR
jgi:LemA protein